MGSVHVRRSRTALPRRRLHDLSSLPAPLQGVMPRCLPRCAEVDRGRKKADRIERRRMPPVPVCQAEPLWASRKQSAQGTRELPLLLHQRLSERTSHLVAAGNRRGRAKSLHIQRPANLATYYLHPKAGRGLRAIKTARGLDQWSTLHLVDALVYHLPKWESGRHNLW